MPTTTPESYDHYSNNLPYPPKGKLLTEMVKYIHDHKMLPAVLPQEACATMRAEDVPRHLLPRETFCAKCPGKTPLSDPVLITQKAKIVMMSDIVQGACVIIWSSVCSCVCVQHEYFVFSNELFVGLN